VTGLDDSLVGYIGVNACHIIPRQHVSLLAELNVTTDTNCVIQWFPNNLQQYLVDEHPTQGPNGIASVQNGILLSTALHPYWNTHGFSIHLVFSRFVSCTKEYRATNVSDFSSIICISKCMTGVQFNSTQQLLIFLPLQMSLCWNISGKRSFLI